MNRGQARRETDETGWEDALARSPSPCAPIGTASVVPVSSTRRARSAAETRRGTADPFAVTQSALPDAATARRDWCVDRGDELLPMTTFELWTAIERAEVTPWMRVWREGMECWTPAGELLELSWAAAGTPQPSAEAEATTGPVPLPPEPEPAPPTRTPEREPAPVPRAPREEVQPRGARWVAVGSLMAAAAIAAAFFVAADSSVEAPVEHRSVAELPVPAAALPALGPLGTRPADPPRPVEPARREERGQRRLPRGGGRIYGR